MKFKIVGDRDPFLFVSMAQGDTLFSESDAMVSMTESLDLEARLHGGIVHSVVRRYVSGESLFMQKISASRGAGDVLLTPSVPGDIQILEVSNEVSYLLNSGAFIAAEETVHLKIKLQKLKRALIGGIGGLFVISAQGQGKLAIGGFGSVLSLEVPVGETLVIDNKHIVAWDSRLTYDLSTRTFADKGIAAHLINTQISGEGIVTRFKGVGKVYVSSRNVSSMRNAIYYRN